MTDNDRLRQLIDKYGAAAVDDISWAARDEAAQKVVDHLHTWHPGLDKGLVSHIGANIQAEGNSDHEAP